MKEEKRYFCDMLEGKFTYNTKRNIIIICIFAFLISILGAYLWATKIDNEAYYKSYPEEIYEYLENVADKVIKNGAFYKSEIPEDVTFEFLENENLELSYNFKENSSLLSINITIQISEKFEIQSKTRNISSIDEYNKDLKFARFLHVFILSMTIFLSIMMGGMILLIVFNIISYFHKQIDNRVKE